MLGRIALIVSIFYVVLNIILLRWATRKLPFTFFYDEEYFNTTLSKLLRPRYVGSPGHSEVHDFIEHELNHLGFSVIREDFQEGGNFTNLSGFMNRDADNLMMLTCHYDSKMPKDWNKKDFLSATEAVSCAILLSLAKTMGMFFIKTFSENIDMGLALIFFDGHYSLSADPLDEIRFIGAKEFMESEIIPLENMVVAVTLSYIGAPNQTFASYFEVTNDLHNLAADIELELRKSGQLTNSHVLFKKKKQYDKDLLDDHSLLNELGVPVMHVAPQEYPKVLHTAADNTENLHWPTIRNMIQILVRFVHDFLETWATNVNLKNVFVSDSLED